MIIISESVVRALEYVYKTNNIAVVWTFFTSRRY